METHVHNVRDTSRKAYHELDPRTQQQRVLRTIEILGSSCIADIAWYMGAEKSSISARVNHLAEEGIIEYCGKRPSKCTKKLARWYRLRRENENNVPM